MYPHARLEDLQTVAEKLSIEVVFSDLSNNEVSINSGYCKLKDNGMIILDKALSPEEQIEIFLQTLKKFDLEDIYIPSWIMECLVYSDLKCFS